MCVYLIVATFLLVEPNPVDSLVIEAITTVSFRVRWVYPTGAGVNGGANITGVALTYNTSENAANPFIDTLNISYPVASIDIIGLEPLTNYSVSVVVNNAVLTNVGSSAAVEMFGKTLPNRK